MTLRLAVCALLTLPACTVYDSLQPHEASFAIGPDATAPDLAGVYTRQREVSETEGGPTVAVYTDTLHIETRAPGRVWWHIVSPDSTTPPRRDAVLARFGDAVLVAFPMVASDTVGTPGGSYTFALVRQEGRTLRVQPFVGPTTRGLSEAEARAAYARDIADGSGANGPVAVYTR